MQRQQFRCLYIINDKNVAKHPTQGLTATACCVLKRAGLSLRSTALLFGHLKQWAATSCCLNSRPQSWSQHKQDHPSDTSQTISTGSKLEAVAPRTCAMHISGINRLAAGSFAQNADGREFFMLIQHVSFSASRISTQGPRCSLLCLHQQHHTD